MKPLPSEPYEYTEWGQARVHIDYHVEIEKHYYSVPYQLVGQQLDLSLTLRTVEIFHKSVRGVSEPLEMEERLANLISDQIAPRIIPEIEIVPYRRTHVLAVQIYPSPSRPHYLKRQGEESGVFVRVGSTNRSADRQLVAEMRRFAVGEPFDEQPMPDLDSEALDFRAASELFRPAVSEARTGVALSTGLNSAPT